MDGSESELGVIFIPSPSPLLRLSLQARAVLMIYVCWPGILDLIHVFVESLDHIFENVCELDLIFHTDKVDAEHALERRSSSKKELSF